MIKRKRKQKQGAQGIMFDRHKMFDRPKMEYASPLLHNCQHKQVN